MAVGRDDLVDGAAGGRPAAVAPEMVEGAPGSRYQGSVVVRNRVLSRGELVAYAILSVALAGAAAWLLAEWFTAPAWYRHPLTLIGLSVPVLGVLATRALRWALLPVMTRPRPIACPPGLRVGVATSFVPGVEPLEMLEETVRALVAMDYPHDTWVLDEGDDERVAALCRRAGARHFSRKHLGHYHAEDGPFQSRCKHGNYNAWLYEVGFDRYDVVAGFDPDHVPGPGFLESVLGFFEDPAVGYVQSPQAFANADRGVVARGSAEESLAFYACDQMASDAKGAPIIIGCHNTHRVSALKRVGGYAPHFADDILLTALYQRSGWSGVYVPRVLARGLAPEDWGTYIRQQRRWARALIDFKARVQPKLARGMTPGARLLGLLHGLSYLVVGIVYGLLLLTVVAGLSRGVCLGSFARSLLPPAAGLVAALALCEGFTRRFYPARDWRRGLQWRAALTRFAKWPFFLVDLGDVFRPRRMDYGTTPKVRPGRRAGWPVLWPHGLTIVVVGAAMLAGWARGEHLCPVFLAVGAFFVAASAGVLLHEVLGRGDPGHRTA